MQFLQREDVLAYNKAVIDQYGGLFSGVDNVKNIQPLDYLLDLCQHNEVFGQAQYPTVPHIAALLLFKLVTSHVFNDGNKRTALLSCDAFLQLNGFQFKEKMSAVSTPTAPIPRKEGNGGDFLLVELIEELADSTYGISYEEVLLFLERNTVGVL